MPRRVTVLTMITQELSCALQALIGPVQRKFCYQLLCYLFYMHVSSSTCAKLANGEIQVARDQWPIFLYANYTYDAEDPWNGLLHSGLLVLVNTIDASSYMFLY